MDSLVFTGRELSFSELTDGEELHLNNILKLNHESNGCAGRTHNKNMPRIRLRARATADP